MIPVKYAHILFGFVLSGLMSCLVSGISTLRATGADFTLVLWGGNWIASWIVAFPAVLIVAPIARRVVAKLTR
ncbi:MAG: DUF2798 domain-containing protein [Pseudomonadota bacterium]